MTLVVIALIVLAIAVWDTHRRVLNVDTTANRRVSDLRNDTHALLQDIADQIDAGQERAEAATKRISDTISIIDTKLASLGLAAGLTLENGLWQKVVARKTQSTAKKATPVAPKAQTKRGTK